jgi:hypothetical protein
MTAALVAWVRALIGLGVVGAVVDWVLPEGGVKRYAGLVVGLCLTAAIVAPLVRWTAAVPNAFALPTWWMANPKSTTPVTAAIWRQQAQDVAAVLEALPGVRSVAVHAAARRPIVVAVTVAPADAASVRRAAESAFGALMPSAPWRLSLVTSRGGEHAHG